MSGQAWGLTVDHGLRRESADEARAIGSWLGTRGIPHDILRWVGPKPTSGIQEAAREARYRLLMAWCRDRFCLHLLTAHHLEDQIETHLIRRRAGSGIDGLAGMSAVRELSGCRLVRPLLAVSRERLAALLATEEQPFLRDPSNLNPVFERARLRLMSVRQSPFPPLEERVAGRGRAVERLPALSLDCRCAPATPGSGPGVAFSGDAGEGLASDDSAPVAAKVRACARARIAHEQSVDVLSARAVALHPAGFGVLDPGVLAAADPVSAARLAVARRLLSRRAALSSERSAAGPLVRRTGPGAADGAHARWLSFHPMARPAAGLARAGTRRSSCPARTWRRTALGSAFCRLTLAGCGRRGQVRASRAARWDGSAARFWAHAAAARSFRAACVLGWARRRERAASRLFPARADCSREAFVSTSQAADTAELYSCLGSRASYLLLARHLRQWRIGPGAEGVGKGL